ncbi:MAG: tRNA (adenosine(37)-N6)-dimethylallyltransferase MiaA [Desulfovibrionaceae bacterium]
MNKPRVICLVGPTGSGKTAAALLLADKLHGAVINADSRQVYADFPLITAQPSAAEQGACPHYLYGFLPTVEKMSAGQWVGRAVEKIHELCAQGLVPILVGGTGLYFKALLEGIAEIPAVDAEIGTRLLQECRECGPQTLHKRLMQVDAVYAGRIHPHDTQRIMRALEVWEGTGKTFSWWHSHAMPEPACVGLRVGLDWDLATLTPRLYQRIDHMLAAGAVDEARAAWTHCADAGAAGWSGIGCAELLDFICERRSLEATRALWATHTRAYAKRQLTWFRADTQLHWFAPGNISSLCGMAQNFIFSS